MGETDEAVSNHSPVWPVPRWEAPKSPLGRGEHSAPSQAMGCVRVCRGSLQKRAFQTFWCCPGNAHMRSGNASCDRRCLHLFSRPPWFVFQNAGCTPIRFCLTDAAPGEIGCTSNSEDALELSGQRTEGDRDSGTAGGSARGRGRGAGPRRPPPSGNSGHFGGCSVSGLTR